LLTQARCARWFYAHGIGLPALYLRSFFAKTGPKTRVREFWIYSRIALDLDPVILPLDGDFLEPLTAAVALE
jgi:hypothetical protein